MFTFTHSVETIAGVDAIWPLYAEVERWLEWDRGLDAIELDGPFVAGATGTITPAGMPTLPFRLTRVVAGRAFDDETPFEGHVLRFLHDLEPLPGGGTRITHAVEIEGPAADAIGPNVTGDTPEAMAALVALAEASRVAVA